MARPKGSGTTPVLDRLRAKTVYPSNGCFLWTGSKTHNGYGEIRMPDRSSERVHRLSYSQYVGPIEEGLFVLHKCDCRHCWNPEHLFLGTAADSTEDMMHKGRHVPAPCPGEANGNAIITDEIVRKIRADGRRIVDIAADYGIHFTTVSDIRRRKSWRHVE